MISNSTISDVLVKAVRKLTRPPAEFGVRIRLPARLENPVMRGISPLISESHSNACVLLMNSKDGTDSKSLESQVKKTVLNVKLKGK